MNFTMNGSAIIFSNCTVPVQPVADPLSFWLDFSRVGVVLRLVHTSDGIGSGVGIGSARSVTIQCKSKRGIGSGVGSSTESESEGSEEFLFLPIPLPLPSYRFPQILINAVVEAFKFAKIKRWQYKESLRGVNEKKSEKYSAQCRAYMLKGIRGESF